MNIFVSNRFKHYECCVHFHKEQEEIYLCGVENKLFAQKILLDMLEKGPGSITLHIYSLNDSHPSWFQLMIKKMWVAVPCCT